MTLGAAVGACLAGASIAAVAYVVLDWLEERHQRKTKRWQEESWKAYQDQYGE